MLSKLLYYAIFIGWNRKHVFIIRLCTPQEKRQLNFYNEKRGEITQTSAKRINKREL